MGPRSAQRDDLLPGLALFLLRRRLARDAAFHGHSRGRVAPVGQHPRLRRRLSGSPLADPHVSGPVPECRMQLETEEICRGTKHGVDLEILMSLFTKGPEADLGPASTSSWTR